MIESEQRMLRLSDGKRLPVRLDGATWTAIDWLSNQAGMPWSNWCATVIEGSPDSSNVTATIRSAAMGGILNATIFADRVALSERVGPIGRCLQACDDREFNDVLNHASVEKTMNFGGYAVAAGISDGCVCFLIKNNMKNLPNLIINTPFTDNQWALGMENRL